MISISLHAPGSAVSTALGVQRGTAMDPEDMALALIVPEAKAAIPVFLADGYSEPTPTTHWVTTE
jgi:hypothetical protein